MQPDLEPALKTAPDTRGSGWIQTFTGRRFYPADPEPDQIDPADIAHALSLLCRYGGHVRSHLSVAEHCVLMSRTFDDPVLARWALLHDATEAYVVDLPRPLKRQLPAYQVIEDRVALAVAERFGLDPVMPAAVKDADNRILLDERSALLTPTDDWDDWGIAPGTEPLGVKVTGWSALRAETEFWVELDRLSLI